MIKFKLTYQIDQEQRLEYFSSPLDLEYRYFELSKERHSGPSAIKISPQEFIVEPAYYRLDADWVGEREQQSERSFLWTPCAWEFQQPNEFQIRAVGKMIGSGAIIGKLLGITDREWRYMVSGDRKMSFARWRILLELAGLVEAVPVADDILFK